MSAYLTRSLGLALLVALSGAIAGCHTVQGAGADITAVGNAMERAAP